MNFDTKPIKIYNPTISELKMLMSKYPLRLLYNGTILYVWNAEEGEHSRVRNQLRNDITDIDSYDGFMIASNHLICSLQNKPADFKRLIKSYFPFCKMNKDDFGIILYE